jgi:CRISPR-associated protein Cmr3
MTHQPAPPRATLFFEPLDVLHFRDHRPFDAGWHTHARSVFPLPSVFLGCLRTALLTRMGAGFEDERFGLPDGWAHDLLGSKSAPGSLSLRGPFPARLRPKTPDEPADVEGFLPLPLDLRSPEKNGPDLEIQHALRASVRRYHGAQAQQVRGPVPWGSEPRINNEPRENCKPRKERPAAELLSLAGAGEYLNGRVPACEHRCARDDLYKREARVGIVRSDEHLTADDHLLYATEPFRFAEGAGLAVEVKLPTDSESHAALKGLHHAIVPLGGKGHRARLHYLEKGLLPAALDERPSYKLWLVTPLVLSPELGAWPAEITCAAGERTVPVGGFDLAKRAPKPLRHALPAGTVLRVQGLSPDEALQRLAGADDPSLNSQWLHDQRAGFGVALVAKEATHP